MFCCHGLRGLGARSDTDSDSAIQPWPMTIRVPFLFLTGLTLSITASAISSASMIYALAVFTFSLLVLSLAPLAVSVSLPTNRFPSNVESDSDSSSHVSFQFDGVSFPNQVQGSCIDSFGLIYVMVLDQVIYSFNPAESNPTPKPFLNDTLGESCLWSQYGPWKGTFFVLTNRYGIYQLNSCGQLTLYAAINQEIIALVEDELGQLYTTVFEMGCIYRISTNGTVTTYYTEPRNGLFYGIYGLFYAGNGLFYFTGYTANTIYSLSKDKQVNIIAQNIMEPMKIVFSKSVSDYNTGPVLYVSVWYLYHNGAGAIARIPLDGSPAPNVTYSFIGSHPYALQLDSQGNLWSSASQNSKAFSMFDTEMQE